MLWRLPKYGMLLAVLWACLASSFVYAKTLSEISITDLKNQTRFTTWQGIEPDKWATLWLIKRHISPDAYFLLVPPNDNLPAKALPFGVPDAVIRRANRESMFHRLKQAMNVEEQVFDYIDAIIHDIEVNIWDAPTHPHTVWFETLYRQLQARYRRDQVPVDCYLAFFDAVSRLAVKLRVTANDYHDQLGLLSQCPGFNDEQPQFVEALNHIDVLREISLGKHVVFVDTREDEEYNEVHLPGAQVLRLRDVSAKRVRVFADTDWVVPYCVKDFRGFEVAKAIKQLGVPRVATLSPNGLKGWLNAQLPVVKKGENNDADALDALMRCAMEPTQCIGDEHHKKILGALK